MTRLACTKGSAATRRRRPLAVGYVATAPLAGAVGLWCTRMREGQSVYGPYLPLSARPGHTSSKAVPSVSRATDESWLPASRHTGAVWASWRSAMIACRKSAIPGLPPWKRSPVWMMRSGLVADAISQISSMISAWSESRGWLRTATPRCQSDVCMSLTASFRASGNIGKADLCPHPLQQRFGLFGVFRGAEHFGHACRKRREREAHGNWCR